MGWYTDSAMTNKFNYDTKITSNMDLYAAYMDLKEIFTKARAATIDNGKFKYDYKLDFQILINNSQINPLYQSKIAL